MESLEEWLQSNAGSLPGTLKKWAETLVELGASWETFRGDDEETIGDLVDGGIPRLSARDICRAMSEVLRRRNTPLMVLWDVDKVSLTTHDTSAALAVSRIKAAVAPHGRVEQFRAYASAALADISAQTGHELRLSGCDLVDASRHGSKTPADEMIIVDAMQFAYAHPGGAALCFIAGGADYAYLLSQLQKPQWTTIVMAGGNGESATNCSFKLCWETDVLQLPVQTGRPGPAPGLSFGEGHFSPATEQGGSSSKSSAACLGIDGGSSSKSSAGGSGIDSSDHLTPFSYSKQMILLVKDRDYCSRRPNDLCDLTINLPTSGTPCTPLHQSDITLLREIVARGNQVGDDLPGTRKSYVGSMLKENQPGRFTDRKVVRTFLARAISEGAVFETGSGAVKSLHLSEPKPEMAEMKVSEEAPLSVLEMPPKALELSKTLKYIIFVNKMHVPKGSDLSGAYINSTDTFLILMFGSLKEARSLAAKTSSLYEHGVLVNWRACSNYLNPPNSQNPPSVIHNESEKCAMCNLLTPKGDLFFFTSTGLGKLCHSCFISSGGWTETEQRKAQEMVASLLKMMSECDDLVVPRNILRNILLERYSSVCGSRGQASLWIDSAIHEGLVMETKPKKNKVLTLPEHGSLADLLCLEKVDIDTSEAEKCVIGLLRKNGGSMDRRAVNDFLRKNIHPQMSYRMKRALVANAAEKRLFFIAKGPYGQVVGLTRDEASSALSKMFQDKDIPSDGIQSSESSQKLDQQNCTDSSAVTASDSSDDGDQEREITWALGKWFGGKRR